VRNHPRQFFSQKDRMQELTAKSFNGPILEGLVIHVKDFFSRLRGQHDTVSEMSLHNGSPGRCAARLLAQFDVSRLQRFDQPRGEKSSTLPLSWKQPSRIRTSKMTVPNIGDQVPGHESSPNPNWWSPDQTTWHGWASLGRGASLQVAECNGPAVPCTV